MALQGLPTTVPRRTHLSFLPASQITPQSAENRASSGAIELESGFPFSSPRLLHLISPSALPEFRQGS